MRSEPQASPYRPAPAIAKIAPWLAESVDAAQFPAQNLRFRNHRWDRAVGLDALSDEQWCNHFAAFEALPDNLPQPLALKYHGHQFRNYNPDLGDGRGFLFAQLRDAQGRLLDLGTKGSGTTPFSRDGDGRLTLKGAVREILATEWLEALGVNTSKTFSVIETGEKLYRSDEPSPARSAVMVRLSHGHIRIGSFQRLLFEERTQELTELVDYCLAQYPGSPPPQDAPGRSEPAVQLMHHVVERLADTAAAWMVAGFVHGVLNTDNLNITGESFDYGPWRWLPRWDHGFTAAYFDHSGLYAFGRQPEAVYWNCGQLAVALRPLTDAPPLMAALERFGPLYMAAVERRWQWRMGVTAPDPETAAQLVALSEKAMVESGAAPDAFFHRHRFGRNAEGELAQVLAKCSERDDISSDDLPERTPSLLIDRVEEIWNDIAERDNWDQLAHQIAAMRAYGATLGEAPEAFGHLTP